MTPEPRRTIASMIRADKARRGRAKAAAHKAGAAQPQQATLALDQLSNALDSSGDELSHAWDSSGPVDAR